MRISVVVPAFNEERLIGETLRRIQAACGAFSRRGWETELIVCNNNSTDRTAEVAGTAGAKVVFEPVNQIARARNSGAKAASGDWLIFVDADSHPGAELFDDVAEQIQSGRCLAGGCTVKLEGDYPKARLIVGAWNCVSRICRWVAGSFIFCETKAFGEIGGFSQELFASEEIDLSKRLKKLARGQGRKIVILHRHPIATSARKLHLYTPLEHLKFLLRTVLAGGKTLNSREACHTWYDGRR
ncbi:MAG TPA: glycosyltransferase [Candidatus Paceibacterota bacterium]|nr:glycosyltransferase [Candidatus Paceibacterota bacterium]